MWALPRALERTSHAMDGAGLGGSPLSPLAEIEGEDPEGALELGAWMDLPRFPTVVHSLAEESPTSI